MGKAVPVEATPSVPPTSVGLDEKRLALAVDLAARYCSDGGDAGIAMYVARSGVPVLDVVIGHDHEGRPLTPETRFWYASACKPLTAACIAVLSEAGLLSFSDPLVRHLPELAGHGKSAVTVQHLLTHTAGFPDFAGSGVGVRDWYDWDAAVAATCALPLEYPPGSRAAYHPLSYGLLGELVPRLDGRRFEEFFAAEVAAPLAMTTFTWGLAQADVPHTRLGLPGQPDGDVLADHQSPQALSAVIPALNGWGTARDLGRFYLGFGEADGSWLSPATLARMSRAEAPVPVTDGVGSPTLVGGGGAARGLGFEVGTPACGSSVFGELAGPRTFGHPGLRSTVAWSDPDTDLVCVILANGAREQSDGERRLSMLSDAVHRSVTDRLKP